MFLLLNYFISEEIFFEEKRLKGLKSMTGKIGIGSNESGIDLEEFRSFLYAFLYIRRTELLQDFEDLILFADTEEWDHLF